MRRVILILFYSLIAEYSFSQDSIFFTFDTLNIEELVFEGRIPLSDQQVMGMYKTSDLSSIDKINARLPGIYLISRGSYAMEPVMNGFSAGQINITLDGMRMFGACTDKMDPITSYVEPDNLKSIEINHGSGGSQFGSNVGGSYNMELESAQITPKHRVSGNVGGGYESVSEGKSGNLTLNLSGRKLAWRVNGVARKSEIYKDGNGDLVPFTQYSKINMHNSLLFEIDERSHLKADILIDNAADVGYPALPMDVSKADARIYALEYYKKSRNTNESELKIKLYANAVYHVMDDSKRDSLFFIEDSETGSRDSVYMRMDMPGWSNTFGGYAWLNIPWGESQKLFLKIENYTNWSRAEMTMYMRNPQHPDEPPMYVETWPENYRNATSLFAENSFALASKLSLDFGGRIEFNYTKLNSEFGKQQLEIFGYDVDGAYPLMTYSLSVKARYRMSSANSFIFNIGYNERLPSQAEQFGFYLFNAYDGYDYVGNPDLKKEHSFNFQAGYSLSASKVRFSLDGFYYHIRDYIFGKIRTEYDPLNFYASGLKIYENRSFANMLAANAQLEFSLHKNLQLIDLAKVVYGTLGASDPLPLIPPFQNILSLKWNYKQFILMAETEYAAAQNRVSTEFGEESSPAYFLMHLRANYLIDMSGVDLKLSGGIENLLDTNYSEHLDWGNYYRPGRNIYFMLKVAF